MNEEASSDLSNEKESLNLHNSYISFQLFLSQSDLMHSEALKMTDAKTNSLNNIIFHETIS